MNGLEALMGQGQQKERADAAMGIASMSLEGANLPPETEYATEVQRAKNILAAADAQLAMQKGQPQMPAQVVPRTRQQVEQQIMGGGLMDMMRSLGPGMQQRGRQMASRRAAPPMAQQMQRPAPQQMQRPAPQQMQRPAPQMQGQRPPMGGIAGLPAPNMARPQMAAQGGVIGFASGGDSEIEQYIQLDEMFRKYKAEGDMVSAGNAKSEMELMEANNPNLRAEAMKQATRDAGLDPELELKLTPPKDDKPEGVRGFAGPDGSVVSSLPANATAEQVDAFYAGQPIPPKPPEGMSQTDTTILDAALEAIALDPELQAIAASDRVEELMGLRDERAELEAAQQAAREALGARLSPEEIKRRDRRAFYEGVRTGNIGRKRGEEERAQQAERVAVAQAKSGDLQTRIQALEALGLSKVEAERAARQDTSAERRTGMTTAAQVTGDLRRDATTRRGQDINREVAEIYAARGTRPTDQESFAQDYLASKQAEGDPRTAAEILTEGRTMFRQLASSYGYAGRELSEFGDIFSKAMDYAADRVAELSSMMNTSAAARAFRAMTPAQQEQEEARLREEYINRYRQMAPTGGAPNSALTGSPNNRPDLGSFKLGDGGN